MYILLLKQSIMILFPLPHIDLDSPFWYKKIEINRKMTYDAYVEVPCSFVQEGGEKLWREVL